VRTLLACLFALALTGCRSSGHDYLSINDQDREFLRETMRRGRELRREEWRENTDFSGRAPANRALREESLSFLRETLRAEERRNFDEMLDSIAVAASKTREERRAERRFGWLDSGE